MMRFDRLSALLCVGVLFAAPVVAQEFGGTVAINGDQIFVSEPIDADADEVTDSAPRTLYVYTRSGDGWTQTGQIMAPEHDGADYFGRFVVPDGDRLLVGSTAIDPDGDGVSDGAVFVYTKSGNDWVYESTWRPENVPAGVSFGRFASLAGDLLVITALGYETTGAAFVYRRGGSGEWEAEGILTPSSPAAQQETFGYGVHTDGSRIIVAAIGGAQFPGAAYVFGQDASGAWVEEAKLQAEEAQPGSAIVSNKAIHLAVGVTGNHALLGLPGTDAGAGSVLHFERGGNGAWALRQTLTAFDRQPNAHFGAAFHGHDGALWVSAPVADRLGAVYAFDWNADTETFGAVSKLMAGVGYSDAGDGFGLSMASAGNTAVIGQPWDDADLGSVVVFEDGDGGWSPVEKIFIPEERRALASLSDLECTDGMADQFTCDQVDMLSFMPLDEIGATDRGIETNDVWGWTDPQTGREYAIVGRTNGVSFIDVSNPNAPVYVGELPKTRGSLTSSWRDVKVYQNHAFVVADNADAHGMQIFDLTRLRDATNMPVVFDEDAIYDNIASAHNVIINEDTGIAYTVGGSSGGETCGGGLHMIDINDPLSPQFLGCFQQMGTGRGNTGNTHDAQCVIYNGPDTEHAGKEICFGSNETALVIADVDDKDNPVGLSTATYPSVAYTHQGWLTEDQRYFYVNDELDEMTSVGEAGPEGRDDLNRTRTLIWDVTDLDDPVLVKEHFGETFTIDHNLYIVGDRMYQSNYVSGLRVLDISDPENPVEVGHFDTVPWEESVTFDGSWSNYPFFESGTIVVSSGKEGVFFLKYRRPELVP